MARGARAGGDARRSGRRAGLVLGLCALWAVAGCASNEGRFSAQELPGNEAWSSDVHCDSDDACADGEVCEAGVCQMQRCMDDYASLPPLGAFRYFGVDGEIILVGDDHYVDAFDTSAAYAGTIDLSDGEAVRDVAGGNLDGRRPQGVAIAVTGSAEVVLDQSDGRSTLDVGFAPSDLATGDVDGDGLDELVAFGAGGDIAVCDVDERRCGAARIEGVSGRDVAVGDVDGDGFAEAIFLYNTGDDESLLVWNLDADQTGQDESLAWSLSFDAKEIAAGDPFGRGYDVVVIKHEGGYLDIADDKLQLFDVTSEQLSAHTIHGHTIDVAVGDRDGDERDEIVTLRNDHHYDVYAADDGGALKRVERSEIPVGSSAQRATVLDWDGDSPAGRLVEGPALVAGQPVPVQVLLFPPYPHGAAAGALSASVTVGNSESSDETLSDSVALSLGMTASFGAEAGPFKASVSSYLKNTATHSQARTRSLSVGARHTIRAEPEMFGRDYAAVVVSCGCYHRYRYETDDPAGKLGPSGQLAELMVPVGGQTLLMSSKRYNAMAEALGSLPVIDVPVRVGDPASYPTTPTDLGGAPVAAEDMLFPDPPSFQISDVGYVGFFMVAGESETNEVAFTTTVGMTASFGAFGAGLDVDASIGVTQGYALTVGRDALFAGNVPPVPDDPATPEDDYLKHRLSFTPIVYRQRYLDADGNESGYYVLHFTRGQ